MIFSDGVNVIATRYRNGYQIPPSLYYNYGSEFTCQNGQFDSTGCKDAYEVVISSAPLSGEDLASCIGTDYGYPYPDEGTDILAPDASLYPSGPPSRYPSPAPTKPTYQPHCTGSSSSIRSRTDSRADFGPITKNLTSGFDPEIKIGAKCTWTLVPKDHMLICIGDDSDNSIVTSVYLQPIKLCPYLNKETLTVFKRRRSNGDLDEVVRSACTDALDIEYSINFSNEFDGVSIDFDDNHDNDIDQAI